MVRYNSRPESEIMFISIMGFVDKKRCTVLTPVSINGGYSAFPQTNSLKYITLYNKPKFGNFSNIPSHDFA